MLFVNAKEDSKKRGSEGNTYQTAVKNNEGEERGKEKGAEVKVYGCWRRGRGGGDESYIIFI